MIWKYESPYIYTVRLEMNAELLRRKMNNKDNAPENSSLTIIPKEIYSENWIMIKSKHVNSNLIRLENKL
ncbi:hypothetical protein BLOT_013077 [Blomia tropicalis]|nr:hypothetical protein BLOT_013077 [Blomia tropicalis]